MSHIWSQAARNLGRNRRRTIVTGLALAFGVTLCIATFGVIDGMNAQILHSLTRYDLGHVQVHRKKFVDDDDLAATLQHPDKVMSMVSQRAGVLGSAPRLYGFGLISGMGKSAGVQLLGVDPEREAQVTEIDDKMTQGKYLSPQPTVWPERRVLSEAEKKEDVELTSAAVEDALSELDSLGSVSGSARSESGAHPREEAAETSPLARDKGAENARARSLALAQSPPPESPLPVIMGDKLAQVLGVTVGKEIFLSTATPDGQNEAVFLTVQGIFSTGTATLDRGRVYLHIEDLRRLVHQEHQAHEISVVLFDVENSSKFADALAKDFNEEGTLVRPWNKIRPEIEQMIQMNNASMGIMVAIILFVAALGVVNTMLMAVFERTRELGVLKAIGMSPWGIVKMMLAESSLLVLLGAFFGVTGGLLIDWWLVVMGLDLSAVTGGFAMGNVGINPVIHGVITVRGVLMPVFVLVSICLLASLLPALRAARLQPAIGMRET